MITWCDGGVLQVHLVSDHTLCDDYLVWCWCFCRFIWCRSTSGVMITWYGVGVFAGSSGVGARVV